MLGTLSMVATAQPAAADVDEGNGHLTSPGQPYAGIEPGADWVGSYVVNGEQVFCVQFEYKAPDSDEKYEPGDELLTKWGEKLSDETAGNISYLLLRYGDTQNADEAAALAHLLHSWTSAPRTDADLDPSNGVEEIAYDAPFHIEKLPAGAQKAVESLQADAEANRGPWTTSVTAPEDEQTVDSPGEWKLAVNNAQDAGVPDVPVTIKLSDATTEDGKDTATVQTGPDGTAAVNIIPKGAEPKVTSSLSAPADRPYVQDPVDTATQKVVSTGGEQELTAEATTEAKEKQGTVKITKHDSKADKGIPGVALRVTGANKTDPATGQDGAPLVGADGKPIVVTTEGADGAVSVDNVSAPQQVCAVEVSAPSGYDDKFDPNNPPAACGEVTPGETLYLQIDNSPNEVPKIIPAGTEPTALVHGDGTSGPSAGSIAGLGIIALTGSAAIGLSARRRIGKR